MQLVLGNGSVLLFELTPAFPLLPLDPFPFSKRQHLLILDPKFSAAQFHVVQSLDDLLSFVGTGEVGKG